MTQQTTTLSVDQLCERVKKNNPGHYYAGDYHHQAQLLDGIFGAAQAHAQVSGTQTMANIELARIRGQANTAQKALRRRMTKFFNLQSKYNSNGKLRTL